MTFMLIDMMLIRLRKVLELRSLVKLLASPNPPSDGWGRERYRQIHDICAKVVGIKVSILFHCLCISSVTFLLPACEEDRRGGGGGKACLACGQSWRCRFSSDMEFFQKFTPPDFKVKNFTPSTSPYFNSFSGKKHKKWVKMEKFTPLAKILHCHRHWRHGQIPPLQANKELFFFYTPIAKLPFHNQIVTFCERG